VGYRTRILTYDHARRASIAWVRVYRTERGDGIAVAVEPDDNPGTSAINAAESLLTDLGRAFPGVQPLRVFVHFPNDRHELGWIELRQTDEKVAFERLTSGALRVLLGVTSFDEGDVDEPTCSFFAGAQHPLLGLIPPPEPTRDRLRDLGVIAVADLPWPHNPSECKWGERFQELDAFYPSSGHPDPAVRAHWFLTLTDDDLAGCPYHRADWHRIAEVSVDLFRSFAADGTLEDLLAAVEAELGSCPESRWCSSLFLDPIVCSPTDSSVTNGQHRACALRAGGAPLCVVGLDGEYVREPQPTDPWRRAAGDVAAFWARYAGS
jgi:hypothetical protein